ncbi:hypothetical protein Y032_0006g3108 [Ancylostoma ceylanicum]|uniref:Uncharacterized protein n=1 Tax=Ancylostoma ceylanicum TaxID=53326 RepID=A0A016VSD0_9BILA|nr:hypothetical protein Y032_0006g3108 [Ancylostoma ceylanicum]
MTATFCVQRRLSSVGLFLSDPISYGLKFDDVNAVLKALLVAITRRPAQYLEGALEAHYSMISGAIQGTSMMEKLNNWIQFDSSRSVSQ